MKIRSLTFFLGVAYLLLSSSAFSLDNEPKRPKIAVSNLAYQKEVKDYFFESQSNFKTKTQHRQNANIVRQSEAYQHEAEASTKLKQTIKSKTEFRELKQFTADIKGELIKSENFEVVESAPYISNNERIYDVIKRIKMKNFKGADYVLFGVLNSVQTDESVVEIKSTSTNSHQHFINLQADFSLIDTKTLKVIAAFSSMGNAQQTILADKEKSDVVQVNSAKLMTDLSKDFAADVIRQINTQLSPNDASDTISDANSKSKESKNSEVTVYY